MTAKQREALEILVDSSRGHSDLEEVAYLMMTTPQGAGRVLHGLQALGFAYYWTNSRNVTEWWPTEGGRQSIKGDAP